ncbi:hypothetical protein HFO56_23805 [Rhizobium laguerreae]|uniref:hypothetical protein n=1 Tax=Rhizobium laguerreae TaxID=1076926 RepID=UPI001C90DF41|nr:hypothetical protein [Rhizobium laguerreae]MBY3155353.1 hypothetical protein [Rhizobium laguerreae]
MFPDDCVRLFKNSSVRCGRKLQTSPAPVNQLIEELVRFFCDKYKAAAETVAAREPKPIIRELDHAGNYKLKDVIRSPDEALLRCAAKAMRLAYKGFGISPLAIQFWPAQCAVAVSSLVFLAMGIDVDPIYLLVAGLSALWTIRFWKSHFVRRTDSTKEWSADLYRTYSSKAAVLRTQTSLVRHGKLFAALAMTVVSISDVSEDIHQLSTWQRCVFPLDYWVLVALAYSTSAEPPVPDDGDLLQIASRA